MTDRRIAVLAYGGLLGLVALVAEHLCAGALSRYLRRMGL